jgi:MurNAc alpha-1-phosphate uridylyltransferase
LDGQSNEKFSIVPILRESMRRNEITGEHYRGAWNDVGTPERLAELNSVLSAD